MFSMFLNKRKIFILPKLLVFSFLSLPAFCQVQTQVPFNVSLANKNQNFLKEKVYVHTDRSFYLTGDVIWFKAYVVNAANSQFSSLSKVLYVEVINNLNQPVLQGKIDIEKGSGNGSFYLPFTVSSGNYVIRAYTNWMKNFSAETYFQKEISIANTSQDIPANSATATQNFTADFFPEGGNLVSGIKSVIGYKITGVNNEGVSFEGFLIDENKDTITRFQPFKFGMGHFSFTPENGRQYSTIINFNDGSSIVKKLPKALADGYVMHVSEADTKNITVSVEAKNLQSNSRPEIFIVIQNRQRVDFAQSLWLQNNKAEFRIPADSLRDGISRITVFDANKNPVSERLYFKRPKNQLVIVANTDKENYEKRSKVVTQISTSDKAANLLNGNLSAAVYRIDADDYDKQEDILSYLLLASEIKGEIEDPAYYFQNENPQANEALENLLLTQGWRKFEGENSFESVGENFDFIPEYKGHFITGKVINEITDQPAAGIPVYLSVPGRRVQLRVCISDSKGLVHFEMKDFYGPNQIVLQTNSEVDSVYRVEIFSPFSEKTQDIKVPRFVYSGMQNEVLADRNIHMEVQNTYHQNKLMQIEKHEVDSVPFYFHPTKTYILSDYVRFTTMEEVLREYVLEINVRKNGSQYRFGTFNAPGFALRDMQYAETIFEKNPLVLLDGVPVFDMNKIIAYDPLKVEKLEVVAQKYHYGTLTAEGIASFTTYKGNLEGFKLNPHDIVLDYEGLQQKRVFYSPEYATEDQHTSRSPDFRELLFWAPQINTDKNGKAQLSFYTGDIPGKYVVVVQGLSPDGLAGSYNFTFDVKK
jgi:hypothetical protein